MRVLVADDHEIVRKGIRSVLNERPDLEVVGEAGNGKEAVALAKELSPDLIIMDIAMPELSGLTASRKIRSERPDVQILMLTIYDSEPLVHAAFDAGARGIVLKSDAGKELLAAVDALIERRPFFTGRVSEIVLDGFLRAGALQSEPGKLTPREIEIVHLLADGKSNRDVATTLGISVKTAETHRSRILAKLNLHNVGELVRYAVRNHIVEP